MGSDRLNQEETQVAKSCKHVYNPANGAAVRQIHKDIYTDKNTDKDKHKKSRRQRKKVKRQKRLLLSRANMFIIRQMMPLKTDTQRHIHKPRKKAKLQKYKKASANMFRIRQMVPLQITLMGATISVSHEVDFFHHHSQNNLNAMPMSIQSG